MKSAMNTESWDAESCVFYIDTRGLMAYVSDYCCQDLGYSREELVAHAVMDSYMLPERQRVANMLAECLNGKDKCFETTVRRRDGSTFPAEISMEQTQYGNRMLLRCDLSALCHSGNIH